MHPGMMMQAKHKLIVPSFATRPKGRKRYRVRIRPPNMFEDKWYTQEDLCPVGLLSFAVSAASLTHPFCPPLTNNPCITFQVLKDNYYQCIGVNSSSDNKTKYENLCKWLYSTCTFFETTQVLAQLNPNFRPANKQSTDQKTLGEVVTDLKPPNNFHTGNNPVFGMCTYKPTPDILEKARKWFWDQLQTKNDLHSDYGKANLDYMEYHTGIYSSIFLSPQRNLQFPAAYLDVTYNPNCDRGVGNMIWFQYSTKMDTEFNKTQCKCVISDIPLWAGFHGYADFIEQELSISAEIHNFGIVCFRSPYTLPPCYNKSKPQQGYVFYDTTFGNGKMPDGSGHIPIYWQQRWFVRLAFQTQVMHDLVMCGPFSYKDDLANTTFTCKYKFDFLWGGNMISKQVLKNPCNRGEELTTYPHRIKRDIQIVDPTSMGPQYIFHTFDYRRGLFGSEAIKRVSEKPTDAPIFTNPFKRPRYLPPTDLAERQQEEGYDSQEERARLHAEGFQVPASPPQSEQLQQQQLQLQLADQQQIGQQLRFIMQQVLKTQAGLQLNPLLFQEL